MNRKVTPLAVRFWAKVLVVMRTDEPMLQDERACWPWQGAKCGGRPGGGSPYGTVWIGPERSTQKKAHVVSFFLQHGYWPTQDVCHKCDNPLCVNPHHLFEASHQANMLDYIRKYGRIAVEKRPLPPRPMLPFESEDPGEGL